MVTLLSAWRRNLRKTFTGADTAAPGWVLDPANGVDGGYFGPESAAWSVHGSMTTLVGGIRSLLVQSLHPGAMAGVHEFSNYREDPLGRLAGTIRWIFTVTYGDTTAAKNSSARVLRLHERVHGSYTDARGITRPIRPTTRTCCAGSISSLPTHSSSLNWLTAIRSPAERTPMLPTGPSPVS